MKYLLTGLITFLFILSNYAQYPSYFSNNIENGAPSNEIYCILEDKDGYLWIGCDAGVYRFNGITYEHFGSSELTARSATGLVQSPSGKIYGYNFNSQVFCIDNEKLSIIPNFNFAVNGIVSDKKGGIWISAMEGCYVINDSNLKWTRKDSKYHLSDSLGRSYTSNIRSDVSGKVYYHNTENIIVTHNNKDQAFFIDRFFFNSPMVIARSPTIEWIFSLTNGIVFRKIKNDWTKYTDQRLLDLLKDRKINSVIEINKKIWINTHTGTICFDPSSGETELFYPKIAFSDCITDREGNYWFSTLHHGLLRFTSLDIRTWNRQTAAFEYEQFSHINISPKSVFFANTGGEISVFNNATKRIFNVKHEPQADIGMLYYDQKDQCTYFNKIGFIYKLNEQGEVSLVNPIARAMKAMLHVDNGYLLLSSQGLYFSKEITEELGPENQISEAWFRDVTTSPFSKDYFLASNIGLAQLQKRGDSYSISSFLVKEKQVLSVCSSLERNLVYFLTYDGIVHSLDKKGKITTFLKPENGMRPTQIRYYKGSMYLATNKGILKINLKTGNKKLLTSYDGLSSNNIRYITFENDNCWAASGKGIVLIPLKDFEKKQPRGRILKKGILINGEIREEKSTIQFRDVLTILANGLSYRSNSEIQFAYRIPGHNNEWILVPASAGKVEIPHLPTGKITVELKMIDHNGNDSLNLLTYNLTVVPPFWQRWWFYVLIVLFVAGSAYLIFRSRIKQLRKKQQLALKQLQLENELRLNQQNALKAQMNPHFLFNVLNSIKGYIYENDKKNAARYLSDFSNLVRKVLELSSLPTVSLEREVEAVKLYIDLEAMLLQSDFTYSIHIDENIDVSGIMVPALLIQPYVENAFKHGLRHKTGEKYLEITIRYNAMEELLIIEISDNGIGRSASQEINELTRAEHQSFASVAMEKRLELLNHEKKGVVGVEIFDKFDSEGRSAGTTVTIRIHV